MKVFGNVIASIEEDRPPTMIERVARAISRAEASDIMWEAFVPEARAAIAAMREPTEEMCGAGFHDANYMAIWQAMIDAALC